ncbi:hypothetical protein [Photobacterium sanguinicancri]|uniref:KfrA N-terminal DNA-binding domain-containing protein n=1 Tax=Photobacterium sanguinicancri TaxID=875932 RepID=A0AAW7Y7R8_9GAMM|nr:hypothetical protein [Photobacterium sanguinicancri]MDO6544557.1 hypothetical protein [Photobacterium sanguinicancri]
MQTTNMALLNPLQGSTLIDPNIYFLQIKSWLEAGKALETITANQLQQAVGGSYQNALQVLEELDSYIAGEQPAQTSVDFPFSLINQMHNMYFDAWRVMFGVNFVQDTAQGKAQVAELSATQAELASVQALLAEKEADVERLVSGQKAVLDELESDVNKAVKAKQTAQQNARKTKAAHTSLQKDHSKLIKQHTALTVSLEKQQASSEQTKAEYEKLVEEMEAQSKHQLDAQRRHVEELNEQLARVKQELVDKNQQLGQQHHENQN